MLTVSILYKFKLNKKMENIAQLSSMDKMAMIRQRYKSTKDMWLYMTERRK